MTFWAEMDFLAEMTDRTEMIIWHEIALRPKMDLLQ